MNKNFYNECANILGTTHNWIEPPKRRCRWNARANGNGRFEGFGIIRYYGPTYIHVALNHPQRISRVCKSEEQVYKLLQELITPQAT